MQRFEDLEIWQLVRKLAKSIYDITLQDNFARDFMLKDQMKGCSGLLIDNSSEGFGKVSRLAFV